MWSIEKNRRGRKAGILGPMTPAPTRWSAYSLAPHNGDYGEFAIMASPYSHEDTTVREQRFRDAAEHDRIDEAAQLLKELDEKLSGAEAAPFREEARQVLARARLRLAENLKQAVHEKRWNQAVEVGQRIVVEWPNTRMAQEVRDLFGVLRRNAGASKTLRAS